MKNSLKICVGSVINCFLPNNVKRESICALSVAAEDLSLKSPSNITKCE